MSVRLVHLCAALGIVAPIIAAPAAAQITNAPAEVRAKIAAMGAKLDPELIKATLDMYVPLVKAAPPLSGVTVTSDIAYGDDPRQKLDLYQPQGKHGMPVVVFVHGGGYVAGAKNGHGGVIYANVPSYFARHGMLGVNIEYRLAPQHPWPAGAEDIGKAVAWLKANAEKYGGNPDRIFVIGHSAGATHVASYVFDSSLQPKNGPGIAGAILVSGFYRVTPQDRAPNVIAYFGKDASQLAARSPITHIRESKVPLLIVTAEYDPVFLAVPSYKLAAAVCARDGKCPRFAWLAGHNHISEAASIDTKDEELGRDILAFIQATR